MTTQEIETQIKELEVQLTGDMFQDMELRDKIHNLKLKLTGAKPVWQEIECEGCGS